jgi:hypothetical protein
LPQLATSYNSAASAVVHRSVGSRTAASVSFNLHDPQSTDVKFQCPSISVVGQVVFAQRHETEVALLNPGT